MWVSKESLHQKLTALRDETANTVLFFVVSGMYLALVGILAIVTIRVLPAQFVN